jgi:adenosine deaminase
VNENLVALHAEGGMTREEIVQLVRNGFEVAWIDAARRAAYLARLEGYLARQPLAA